MDLPEVIAVRRQYYEETDAYKMVSGNAENPAEWLGNISNGEQAIVIMDVYTTFAVKASKYKNPINTVGAGVVTGIDEPNTLELNERIRLVKQLSLTPEHLVNRLTGFDKYFFKTMFAGKATDKLYCMYEYEMNSDRRLVHERKK